MGTETFAVILPAAGRSSRFGDPKQKKIYAELDGRAVWLRAVDPFLGRDDVVQIIVAIDPSDRESFERRYRPSVAFLNIRVVEGGAERSDSIARALEVVDPSIGYVAVHDAARPCLTGEIIDAVFEAARRTGAALPAVAVADTLKRVGDDRTIVETVSRAGLFAVQTPQVFRRDLLVRAYADRDRLGPEATDDARLVEALGHPCVVVDGSPENLKITTRDDLRLADAILRSRPAPKPGAPAHPFADESNRRGDGPAPKVRDLFS